MAESYQQMLHDVEALVEDSTPHGVQHDDEHHAPERTYMQGTQDHDGEATWERRDIAIGALIKWIAGLGIVMAITMVILIGMFWWLMAWQKGGDRIPSPLFVERTRPPAPYIYPNPEDHRANHLEPMAGPADFYLKEHKAESEEADKLGLRDPKTGLATMPEEAFRKVVGAGDDAATAPPMEMPSEASGGTKTDNRLQ